MIVREYLQSDCKEVIKLFFDTIHTININDYTKEQVQAWAGKSISNIDCNLWNKELSSLYTLVAEENSIVVGFGNITDGGYLDKLFVHKNFQKWELLKHYLMNWRNMHESKIY